MRKKHFRMDNVKQARVSQSHGTTARRTGPWPQERSERHTVGS